MDIVLIHVLQPGALGLLPGLVLELAVPVELHALPAALLFVPVVLQDILVEALDEELRGFPRRFCVVHALGRLVHLCLGSHIGGLLLAGLLLDLFPLTGDLALELRLGILLSLRALLLQLPHLLLGIEDRSGWRRLAVLVEDAVEGLVLQEVLPVEGLLGDALPLGAELGKEGEDLDGLLRVPVEEDLLQVIGDVVSVDRLHEVPLLRFRGLLLLPPILGREDFLRFFWCVSQFHSHNTLDWFLNL